MTKTDILAQLSGPFGTYRSILEAWAELQPDQPALRDGGGELSWAEMMDRVDRIAAQLQATGLEQGQSVAILGTSTIHYALVYLAAVLAGGVAAPLTTSASPLQLDGMAKDSGARHLFIDRAKLNELGDGFMPDFNRIVLDEELEDWMTDKGTKPASFEPTGDEPFNIIYSSGTTGIPKGIVHSHTMRWRQFAPTAASYLGGERTVRSLTSTPLYSNTTMVAFLSALLAGGTVTIMEKFDTVRWLEIAQRDRITTTMLVPVQYQRLMDEPSFDRFDLSSLQIKYCTSAPFSAELKAEVLERMPGALIEIYSMTEGGVVCLLYAHEHPDKLHTVGTPAPGSDVKVMGEDGRLLPPGEAGELVGRGPAMMSGYKNQPDKTSEAQWIDPDTGEWWMRMGDIGRVDEDGFVELVGRAKDMIISGGFNIYPIDLENELLREAGVVEAAVIGVPSNRWGETPVGFAVLDGVDPDDVLRAVNARLGKTQRLSALLAIDEMPRSHIGKLLKIELRERAGRLKLPS
ncbi:class I adenylate-forming enzyme family protein [Pontixanthobacter aestiaquae]|uniref:AMP-binding protein n=1 Tax=Pontixanthobacter aestiaquae TaxID=1509367 RepID=A0A844Z353_9SPHN|nr:class I adenylate-forming enzyme family protein [Pontixanthobacter aestiaquae]MDN3646651.1 class I adenylate-forming enzyme family protein [Pontixanthobacter aestiaquae]MXO82365.1 AMP-binding protein [Pontixanthobacter aestiaquae]